MNNRGSRIILYLFILSMWMLMTFRLDLANILVGVLVALPVTYFASRIDNPSPERVFNLSRYLWFLYFIPIFVWEMIKANLDVAYRVLHPALPINPGLVKVKTRLKGDLSRAVLCNAITLTPGTTTVDIVNDEIYVHWIDVKTRDEQEMHKLILRKYEDIIERIFE